MSAHIKHIITHVTDCPDNGIVSGGLAAVKVANAYNLYGASSGLDIAHTSVVGSKPFDTIDAGGKAADLYQSTRMHGDAGKVRQILAVNAAPPKSDKVGQPNNERENMVVGTLKDGTIIGGTIKGYALSYLKDEIAELREVLNTHDVLQHLYGDAYQDGMRQFRSHYLLSHLLIDAARQELGAYDLATLDVATDVPDPSRTSHVLTIDNFGNVKLWLSEEDCTRVAEAAQKVNGKDLKCTVAFSRASLEVEEPHFGLFSGIGARMTKTMFSKPVGTNVFSEKSSSRHGDRVLPQLCTLQSVKCTGTSFRAPPVGAAVRLKFG